tara:strand:- start:4 stop:258 length:255 start_codon:yes stop_codon:yes gene_type:complete
VARLPRAGGSYYLSEEIGIIGEPNVKSWILGENNNNNKTFFRIMILLELLQFWEPVSVKEKATTTSSEELKVFENMDSREFNTI